SGSIEINSQLDGKVTNNGVDRYKDVEGRHLDPICSQATKEGILLTVSTKQSKLIMAQACRTRIYEGENIISPEAELLQDDLSIFQVFSLNLREGHAVRVEKVIALYTSRDKAITEPSQEAADNIAVAPEFEHLLLRHQQAW